MLLAALQYVLDTVMVIGPILAYVDQYQKIQTMGSSEGFSVHICTVLLISNILRIFFWLAKHFEIVLLYQSIFMILMQLVLLRQVVRYYPRPLPPPLPTPSSPSSSTSSTTTKSLSDGTPLLPDATSLVVVVEEEGERRIYHKLFPQRPSWNMYMVGLSVLVVVLSVLHVFVATSSNAYVETIGSLALGVEAMLPLPQVIGNFKRKSVQGFSLVVFFTWLIGDTFKTLYYIEVKAPLQFVVCGASQLSMDMVLLLQLWLWRNTEGRVPIPTSPV